MIAGSLAFLLILWFTEPLRASTLSAPFPLPFSISCLSVSARFSLRSSLFFLGGRILAGTIPRSAYFLFGAEPFPPLPAIPGTEPLRASTLSAPFPLPFSIDILSFLSFDPLILSFLFGAEPFPPLPASPRTEPLRASTLSAPFPLPSSFDLLSVSVSVSVSVSALVRNKPCQSVAVVQNSDFRCYVLRNL